jgi:hypothetical protein
MKSADGLVKKEEAKNSGFKIDERIDSQTHRLAELG